MASINETGRSERQNVTPPITGATIGASWYERTRQTLDWMVNDREAFYAYRIFDGTDGSYESFGKESLKVMGFTAAIDTWGTMADVGPGGGSIKLPPERARGWWIFTGQVNYGGLTGGAGLAAPAGSLAYAEIVLKVDDVETVIARDEQWLTNLMTQSLMPHAMLNLDRYPADKTIEVQLRAYQNWTTSGGTSEVWLRGVHLHSHSTEMGGTFGATTWADADLWSAGTFDSAGELVPLRQAIEYMSHDRPAVELYSPTTVSVPTATNTTITSWTDQSDTRSWATASRITVQQQGVYYATVTVAFPFGATGADTIHVLSITNGTDNVGIEIFMCPAGRDVIFVTTSAFVSMASGAFLEAFVQQQSGGTQNVGSLFEGAPLIARFDLNLVSVGGATLVNDARSLPPAKATNDTVTTTEFNQLVNTANWHARSRPHFHVTHATTQTISLSTLTSLTFNSTVVDTHAGWSTTLYNVPIAGWYLIGGAVYFAAFDGTAMNVTLSLRANATTTFATRRKQSRLMQPMQIPPVPIYLAPGNFVEMQVSYGLGTGGTKVLGTGSAAGNRYVHCMYGWLEQQG